MLISHFVANTVEESQSEKASNVSKIVSFSPVVVEALNGQRDEKDIQDFANRISSATDVEFVVVIDMHGIRKSHPDTSKIGKPFAGGDEGPVLKGEEYISKSEGTLGHSLRSFTPILDLNGEQIGAVAVGITLDTVEKTIAKARNGIFIGIFSGLIIGIIGAIFLAKYIKKTLLGLEPFQISKLVEERSAMLHSIREGVIAVDQEAKITVVNKAALAIFKKAGLEESPVGKNVEAYISTSRLKKIMEKGIAEFDEEIDFNGVKLLVNRIPIVVDSKIVGAITTFRDKTEMLQLAEQLTGVRLYAETLRAQAHEFMNKLHVILGMVHLKNYDQLSTYINETVNHRTNEKNTITKIMKDPVVAGFLIGKLSFARESGVDLQISSEYPFPKLNDSEMAHELITIIGNLIDNAMDAVKYCSKKQVKVCFEYADDILTIEVKDTGVGMTEEDQDKVFQKGYSTKGKDRGLGLHLISQSIHKLEGECHISSTPGQGTAFVVYIPYKGEEEKDDSDYDCRG